MQSAQSQTGDHSPSGRPVPLPSSPTKLRQAFAEQMLQHAIEHHGTTLLIDGLAGMGKTYLLRELAALAAAHESVQFAFVRADEIEQGEPYSFIERFVAAMSDPNWLFIPESDTNPVEVARECIRGLATDEGSLRLVVIDDVQWIDAESQRVLRYLIPRVTTRGVFFAFGARSPHAAGSFGEFLSTLASDSPLNRVQHLAPLTATEISTLTLEKLGVGISPQQAQRLLDSTGGSFLRVDSILNSLTASDVRQLQQDWNTPLAAFEPENDPLLYQFEQLSPASRTAVEIVCLAGHEVKRSELAGVAAALRLAEEPEEALSAGVLVQSDDGSTLIARHALLSAAIKETIAPERARAILRALAAATEGYRSLRHTLLAADEWAPELRERVNSFVLSASERGNVQGASELLRGALRLATDRVARTEVLESLALLHVRGKNSYLIIDLLHEYETLEPSLLHDVITTVLSAHQVGHELPRDRIMQLLMSSPESPEDAAVLSFFAFMIVILTMRSAAATTTPMLIERAKSLFEAGPAHPGELADERLAWMVEPEAYILVLDCYRMVHDQQAGEMDLVAAVLPDLTERIYALEDCSLKVDAMVAVGAAHVAIGSFDAGFEMTQQAMRLLSRVNEPWASSTVRLAYAHMLMLQGRLAEATEVREQSEEIAYTSLDVETRSSWAGLRLFIAAATGDEEAQAFVQHARRSQEMSWRGYAPDLAIIAECELARVREDAEAILRVSSGEWLNELNDTRHGFLTYRAHALISTGDLEAATELIEQLAQWRGTRWQEYWGSIDWLRARLAAALEDFDTAKWHFEAAVVRSDFSLPHGLTLLDYGEFLAQQGDVEAARAQLLRAEVVLSNMGANAYLARLQRALDAVGGSVVAESGAHLLEALTDRERQIAEHLAKGRSNNQIAESLVVSVATVRSHVSNVLRKLRLTSRGEVARLLRGGADH